MGAKESYQHIDLSEVLTESDSPHHDLEKKSTSELLQIFNGDSVKVAMAVQKAAAQAEAVIDVMVEKILGGGRVFYIGSGTSGRLGAVDASEIPPTFGVEGVFIPIIAGGKEAMRKAQEGAEDNPEQGYIDLLAYDVDKDDIVLGAAASGRTPYVENALRLCRNDGITTACFVCSHLDKSPVAMHADYPIEVLHGAETISGSTRLNSGTAQKLVYNAISSIVMIKLGKVVDNIMIDMQLTNAKLVQRAINMILRKYPEYSEQQVFDLLHEHGKSIRNVLNHLSNGAYGEKIM